MSVYFFASIVAKPDSADKLQRAAIALVPPVLEEDGCIDYRVFEAEGDPHEIRFFSQWRDEEAWAAHGETPHVAQWLESAHAVASARLTRLHRESCLVAKEGTHEEP
jgi:quinol monooxygenase YgiN